LGNILAVVDWGFSQPYASSGSGEFGKFFRKINP
jgi:hypothetical protein